MDGGARDTALALLGASLALSAALAWLPLADARVPRPLARLVALLAASGAAYSLLGAGRLTGASEAWQTLWRVLAAPGPALLWLLLRRLFDSADQPRRQDAAVPLLLALLPLVALATDATPARRLAHALLTAGAVACVAHGVWRVVAGRADDLDEPRRRLRLLLAGLATAYVAVALVIHRGSVVEPTVAVAALLAAQTALKGVALRLLAGTGGAGHPLLPPEPSPVRTPAPPPLPSPPTPPSSDDPLAQRITTAMRDEHLYRQPGLSVKGLAAHLAVPEYRLRQAIVQTLGHHHFSSFVNSYRLDEVAARLQAPEDSATAITALALDAGFGSLGPFNRAFRERFGATPTEFRAAPKR